MAEMYIGQIIMFGGNFAIRDFAHCDGQLMDIAQNQALYSVLGNTYGGNGTTNFGLPDMRGRAPVHQGAAPWGQFFGWGQPVGFPQIALGEQHLPTHSHQVSYGDSGGSGGGGLTVQNSGADQNAPTSDSYIAGYAQGSSGASQLYTDKTGNEQAIKGASGSGFDVNELVIENAGGGAPFDPSGPRLAITFLMSLQGTYPTRN